MFVTRIIKQVHPLLDCSNIIIKQFSTSVLRPVGIKWRQQNGYPDNHTSRGILTDGPDYSYADGKPTPYTTGQRARIIKQQEYAERVTKLLQLIDKSKNAYKEKVAAEMQDKEKILGRKLKPKGKTLKTKAL